MKIILAILIMLLAMACTAIAPPEPDAGVDSAPPYHDVPCDTLHCTTVECTDDDTPCTCYWPPAFPIRCNGPGHQDQAK